MLRSKANAALGFVIVLVAAGLLQVTFGFAGEKDDRLFPQILLSILIVLGAGLIIAEIKWGVATSTMNPRSGAPFSRQAIALVLAIGYFLSAFVLGFFASTFLFLAAVPGLFVPGGNSKSKTKRWTMNLAYAAAVTAFLYLSFSMLLKFSLPAGLLI